MICSGFDIFRVFNQINIFYLTVFLYFHYQYQFYLLVYFCSEFYNGLKSFISLQSNRSISFINISDYVNLNYSVMIMRETYRDRVIRS